MGVTLCRDMRRTASWGSKDAFTDGNSDPSGSGAPWVTVKPHNFRKYHQKCKLTTCGNVQGDEAHSQLG